MPALKALPSQARVDANRRNAQKSTGPQIEAGKMRSRGNACKHGLAGAGMVIPGEDEAAVVERFAAIEAELAPSSTLGVYLARRVAVAMVRTERAVRHESKAIAHRMRHAAEAYDQARRDAATALATRLADDPRATRRDLLRTPEGLDILVDHLHELRGYVARFEPIWLAEMETLLLQTCGWEVDEFDPMRGLALSRALQGDDRLLSDDDIEQRNACAAPHLHLALALRAVITAEIEALVAHRVTLDHDSIAQDRAEAAERALFDPGKDAQLARRYEAQATRELKQALHQFQVAEAGATVADQPEATVAADPEAIEEPELLESNTVPDGQVTAILGSFGGRASATERPGYASISAPINDALVGSIASAV